MTSTFIILPVTLTVSKIVTISSVGEGIVHMIQIHTHTHTTACNPSTRNPTTVTRANVTTRNFKWLAKVVYHRYTVFVPETDKYTPSLMQQRITTWPNSDPEVQDPMFFSPPIDGLLSEYVSDAVRAGAKLFGYSDSTVIHSKHEFELKFPLKVSE